MQFPNQEHTKLIKDFIILPFVLQLFERDLQVIRETPLKMKEPYLQAIDRIMDKVMKDIATTKKELSFAGIYVYSQIRNQTTLDYQFKFKGYYHKCGFSWNVIRNEVQKYMERYLCNFNSL